MSRAVIRTVRSACQTQLMFTWGTNHVLASEFIYAEFFLLRGHRWCRLMILWWNIPAVRPSNGRHIVRVFQTCFFWISHLFFALYVDGPALVSIRAVRAALFSFSWVFKFYRFVSDFSPHASAGLCGSLRLGLLGSRSDNWFCPPLNAVLLNCISSFVRPLRGGLLDGHMFTHFKSVCMFALASLYIFNFFWPIGDHFCSLWSNLVCFFFSMKADADMRKTWRLILSI